MLSSQSGKKTARPLKKALGDMKRWLACRWGVTMRHLLGSRRNHAFGILMYRRLCPWVKPGFFPTWNVTPERFHRQLSGLLRMGYQAWSLRKALEHHRTGQSIPRNAFVVTFDDGYGNFHDYALPILKELGIPATLFLATAFLDVKGPFPFDDWALAGTSQAPPECWRPLTIEQCRESRCGGLIEIGSHSHTHQRFLNRPEDLHQDLLQSVQVLRDRFAISNPTFSFPFGISGVGLAREVREAGLACGLTTKGELVRPGHEPYSWGRITVEEADTPASLAAQLDGWCILARKSWRR